MASYAPIHDQERNSAMRTLLKSFFSGTPKIVEVEPFAARFEIPGGQTLLESALRHEVPFPHNCTVGTCGSCKCRLKTGRVRAITDFGYTLSKQELDAGYILACQAVPRDELTVVEVEYHWDAPPPEQFTGRIAATESLTHDILKITIELDRPPTFIAGQYANIKSPNVARGRFYSFAEAPERGGCNSVSFFIRKVPGGGFTEALFSGRLENLALEVDGPHGSFYLRTATMPMICVAGGSGLAPLLSLLEDARKKRVRRRCVLLFGARSQADLYALDQINSIAGAWQEPFDFVPVLSEEPANSDWAGARGLVTDFIQPSLADANWPQVEGYMCGPPGMIDAGMSVMTGLGVKLESIHYDKFTDESHSSVQL
jgi:p-cymene methyl-monooxygenase electron transfer component